VIDKPGFIKDNAAQLSAHLLELLESEEKTKPKIKSQNPQNHCHHKHSATPFGLRNETSGNLKNSLRLFLLAA